MKAFLRGIGVSVQKLNRVLQIIRRQPVDRGLSRLKVCRKSLAEPVYKLLSSAVANSRYQGVEGPLYVDIAIAGRGSYSKRVSFRGRGKTDVIRRPSSHASIFLAKGKPTIDPTRKNKDWSRFSKKHKENTPNAKSLDKIVV